MFGNIEHTKVLKFNSNYITFNKPFEVNVMGKTAKSRPSPATLNGEKVYWDRHKDLALRPSFKGRDFSQYIFESIREELEMLPDGNYKLDRINIVLDKEGRIAYFDFDTLTVTSMNYHTFEGVRSENDIVSAKSIQDLINDLGMKNRQPNIVEITMPDIPVETKLKLYSMLYRTLAKAPKFTPARLKNGQTVAYVLDPITYNIPDVYIVKDHKVSLYKIFGATSKMRNIPKYIAK